MSEAKQKLQTAFNETNPVVCDIGLGDLLFHYELAEEESKFVNDESDNDDSFALQRQGSKVVYKVLVKDCNRLDEDPNWVEVEFNDIPKGGKYQLYYQPGVKQDGELGDDILIEKVERLPLYPDFVEFSKLEQGYQEEYEEIVKSDLYQDDSSDKNSDQE